MRREWSFVIYSMYNYDSNRVSEYVLHDLQNKLEFFASRSMLSGYRFKKISLIAKQFANDKTFLRVGVTSG